MSAVPFTDRTRKIMALAVAEAKRRREDLDTGHLLLAVLDEGTGVAAIVLRNLGADFRDARREIENRLLAIDRGGTSDDQPHPMRGLRDVLRYALEEAENLNQKYVGSEHILLGLLRDRSGMATRVLGTLGLNAMAVRVETQRVLGTSSARGKRCRPLPPHISVGLPGRLVLGLCSFLSAAVFGAIAVALGGAALFSKAPAPAPLLAVVIRHVVIDLFATAFAIASIFMLLLAISFWSGGSRWADPLLRKMMPKAVMVIGGFLIAVFVIVAAAMPELRIVCGVEVFAIVVAGLIVLITRWRVRRVHSGDPG